MNPLTLSRRHMLQAGVASLSLSACSGLPRPAPRRAGAPNLVVILADDMGWSDLGSYGGEIPTPTLDRPFFLYLAYTAPHWPLHAPEARIAAHLDRDRAGWHVIHAAVEAGPQRADRPFRFPFGPPRHHGRPLAIQGTIDRRQRRVIPNPKAQTLSSPASAQTVTHAADP